MIAEKLTAEEIEILGKIERQLERLLAGKSINVETAPRRI